MIPWAGAAFLNIHEIEFLVLIMKVLKVRGDIP